MGVNLAIRQRLTLIAIDFGKISGHADSSGQTVNDSIGLDVGELFLTHLHLVFRGKYPVSGGKSNCRETLSISVIVLGILVLTCHDSYEKQDGGDHRQYAEKVPTVPEPGVVETVKGHRWNQWPDAAQEEFVPAIFLRATIVECLSNIVSQFVNEQTAAPRPYCMQRYNPQESDNVNPKRISVRCICAKRIKEALCDTESQA